jgi:class III lanthionine synthetase
MEQQYEAFVMADLVFYDVPHAEPGANNASNINSSNVFRTANRPLPDGWTRTPQDDWLVFTVDGVRLPDQGWKIHASACMENTDRVLDAVWEYCIPRRIEFKFLRSSAALMARVSKYAPRGSSGKLVTIYPADEAACETILRELGEILDGEPNPYILSDLRWGRGPLFVRYGGFRNWYTVDSQGQVVSAITNPDGEMVPDRRGPVFSPPPWVTVPDFLAPHLAARNAATVDEMPYTVERVLHFSNGGGIYVGQDKRTGEQVVLKEARPHCGLDAYRRDAVQRLEREYEILQRLAGIPGIPKAYDKFWLSEHLFVSMEYISGMSLGPAIVRRYPLLHSEAGPAEYAEFTEWAIDKYHQVEATINAMHERGVVYGDMHMFNIMVRDDDSVALLDFEVSAPVEEVTPPGLGNQGFAPPRGTIGTAIDRYGLACLRIATFLPMTSLLWLHRPKALQFAEVIKEYFPIPEGFLDPALELIAPGVTVDEHTPPYEPDPPHWPELRDHLVKAIVASATPERDDRLFPGDPQQFGTGGLGLAYGAAGVLYALAATGAGRYPEYEQWLVQRGTNPRAGTRPGLYDGLHGVAFVLDHLGDRQHALDIVDICLREKWETLGVDLFGGLAGIGLNLLHLADRTGEPALRVAAHRAAELVAERLGGEPAEDSPKISNGEVGWAGLMRGKSGAALLLLRTYDDTGDAGYLDKAAVALRQDLHRCLARDDGTLEVNEGWRTMPYLEVGSAGIGMVLDDYLTRRHDEQFATASDGVVGSAQLEMYIQPGLFTGRAGILLYLAGRSPEPSTDPQVTRQLRNLGWHALPYGGGIGFPGRGMLRLSMDLATGNAGVLLALGAALHDAPVAAPLLTPNRGTPTRVPAVAQAPASTGAGS